MIPRMRITMILRFFIHRSISKNSTMSLILDIKIFNQTKLNTELSRDYVIFAISSSDYTVVLIILDHEFHFAMLCYVTLLRITFILSPCLYLFLHR